MIAENIQAFTHMIDKDTNGWGVDLVTGDGVKFWKWINNYPPIIPFVGCKCGRRRESTRNEIEAASFVTIFDDV